ncbi:MAG: DUF4221 family protein [Bacteroidota bacterium]
MRILVSLCALLLLQCCGVDQTPDNSNNRVSLIEAETIQIPIDSITPYRSKMIQVVKDSLLAILNQEQNQIQIHSLETLGLVSTVNLARSGPNGVGELSAFYYHNQDSIFIISRFIRGMMLVNQQGEKLADYYPPDSPIQFGTLVGGSKFPPLLHKNKLYYAVLPHGGFDDPGLTGQSVEICYDLNTGTISESQSYPKEYESEKNIFHVNFSRTLGDEHVFVYTFSSTPFLFVKSNTTKDVSRFAIQCDDCNYSISDCTDRDLRDYSQAEDAYVEDITNLSVTFDSYRKVYYVFVGHAVPSIDPTIGIRRTFDEKSFSILIYNLAFEKIGEFTPAEHQYLYSDFFVDNAGLWLSNNYRFNPDLVENQLSFTLLRLE